MKKKTYVSPALEPLEIRTECILSDSSDSDDNASEWMPLALSMPSMAEDEPSLL